MAEILIIFVVIIASLIILPKLRDKVSKTEEQLNSQTQERVDKIINQFKEFQKVSNIIIIGIIVIPLLFILYLLAMFIFTSR